MGGGLPREVLKWLQTLDLSYAVKNPRRDFSNGFLVAEIVSRYWKGVPMHSFDNGTGASKKRDNWEQLHRLFRARSLSFDAGLVDGVITCQEGAAVELLGQLYSHLTSRKLQTLPPISHEEVQVPTFNPVAQAKAGPPGAGAAEVPSIQQSAPKSDDAARALREKGRGEKEEDPARFKPRQKVQAMQAMKPPTETQGTQQISFGGVRVKTVENAAALRSARAAHGERSDAGASDGGGGDGDAGAAAAMNRAVQDSFRELGLDAHFSDADGRSHARHFVSRLADIDADRRQRVWRGLYGRAAELGAAVAARPTDAAQIVSVLGFVWAAPAASPDRVEGVQLLAAVGDDVARRDAGLAAAAWRDHVLPAARAALGGGPPHLRADALRVAQRWLRAHDASAQGAALRAVVRALGPAQPAPGGGGAAQDPAALMLCLAGVAAEWPLHPRLEEELHHYAVKGLVGVSPSGRAAAVDLLDAVLRAPLPLPARHAGLAAAARHATPQRRGLSRALVDVLLCLPDPLRARHINDPDSQAAARGRARGEVAYPACCRDWCASGVALAAAELLAKSRGDAPRDAPATAVLDILAAAVDSNAAAVEDEGDIHTWWAVLRDAAADLKDGLAAPPQAAEESAEEAAQRWCCRDMCLRCVVKLFADLSRQDLPSDTPEAREDKAVRWFHQIDLASLASAAEP